MKRRFLLDQLVGTIMIGAAALFMTLPTSTVVSIELLIVFASLFFSFGCLLFYYQTVGHLRFFLLTMPFLIVASVYLTYGFLENRAAFIPAYFMLAFDVVLQYCHARQEEFRVSVGL